MLVRGSWSTGVRSFVLVPVFASLVGCGETTEQVWQLTDFRVLGVQVEPPEAMPGETVTLTLVTADVRPRPVQVVWIVCAAAVSVTGLEDAGTGGGRCSVVTDPRSPLPVPDLRTTVSVTVPPSGGGLDASGRQVLTVLGFACAGGTIAPPASGSTQPRCEGSEARSWQFVRSIHVWAETSLNSERNRNPRITEVRFGLDGREAPIVHDAPPTVPRCTDRSRTSSCPRYRFEVGFSPESRERYRVRDPVSGAIETRTERLTTGYVIEGGTLAGGFRTDSSVDPMSDMENEWVAPERAGTYRLFVYVSDGRGGFDWAERWIRVE